MIITNAGRLARDSVLKQTSSGPVLKFSIPSEFGWGNRKNTTWLNCTVWGKRATSLAPHLTKGSLVEVSGEGDMRQYNGKTYLDVSVNTVNLLGKGGARNDQREEQPEPEPPKSEETSDDGFSDDSVPF